VCVQGKRAAGPENSCCFTERLSTCLSSANHSKRTEHRQCVVEGRVSETAEPTEVGFHSQDRDIELSGFRLDNLKHRPGEINCGNFEPARGESDRMTTNTTPQIDKPAWSDESLIESLSIGFEERMPGEIGILLGGKPWCMGVFPK
jgi:hypothetical protein